MKTYGNYIITRPWITYHVKYDFEKVMGRDLNYGNPLDSPIICDLIYSIDILTNRIRKTQDKFSKKRYIDVVFEMQGDLNFYLRCPRQRYLDDLLYIDKEPNKWRLLKNKFSYCVSDLENLTRNAAKSYMNIVECLHEDFMVPVDELNDDLLEETKEELIESGYIMEMDNQCVLINPNLVKNENKYRYVSELLWQDNVSKEIQDKLIYARNLRVFGMEEVPVIREQLDDFITIGNLK